LQETSTQLSAPLLVADVFRRNDRSLGGHVRRAIPFGATRAPAKDEDPKKVETEMGSVAERTIEARVAERADFGPWIELAAEVEPLFGPMTHDPVFQRALSRNIARGTAFCIRENDGCPGSRLVAGLLLSTRPPTYRIGWLVVMESGRRSGLGRAPRPRTGGNRASG
jgi:hypothetical protein